MAGKIVAVHNQGITRGRLPPGFRASKGIEIKLLELAEEKGRMLLSGYVSTDALDLDTEVVLPEAFEKHLSAYRDNPVYCWQHRLWEPIGSVQSLELKDDGLYFHEIELAATRAIVEEYWPLLKSRTVRSQSIGFSPIKWEDREVDGVEEPVRHYTEVRLWEASAVTIPANEGCRIDTAEEKGLRAYGADAAKLFPALWDVEDRQRGGAEEEEEQHVWSPGFGGVPGLVSHPGRESTEKKRVVPYKDHPLMPEGAAWSGAKSRRQIEAWAMGDGGDINYSRYRNGFIWYDPDAADTRGGYKLPICFVEDGSLKAVLRGVMAAMAVVLGARGGINIPDSERRGVYNHLARYYRKADRDVPEFRSADEIEERRGEFGEALYDATTACAAYGDMELAVAWLLDIESDEDEGAETVTEPLQVYDPLAVTEQVDYEPPGLSLAPLSEDAEERAWEDWACHLLYRTDTVQSAMRVAYIPADGEAPVLQWDRMVVALSQVLGIRSPWRLSPDVKAAALRKMWTLYCIANKETPALALDAEGLNAQPDEVLKTVGWNDLLFRSDEKRVLERHRFMQSVESILSIARHWANADGELPEGVARAAKEVAVTLLLLARNHAPALETDAEGELPRREDAGAQGAEALLGGLLQHEWAAA